MSTSLLQQIRECNNSYRAGQPRLLDSSGAPFIVLACIDSRLTGLLEPALGLPRHRALVIRVAGNQVSQAAPEALRSIAVAVYVKGGRELLVVGHTDCSMASFSAPQVIDSFRNAGVARSAFGGDDLRTWFGAFADIRGNVLSGISFIRRSGILPPDLKVHGLILGTDDGAIEVVDDGDVAAAATPGVPVETGRESVKSPLERAPQPHIPEIPPAPVAHRPHGPKPVSPEPPVGVPPASVAAAATVLRDFFLRESGDAHFQQTAVDLKALLKRERNPARILSVLDRIARDYRVRYPELPATLEYLKKSLQTEGATGMQFMEFIRRILE